MDKLNQHIIANINSLIYQSFAKGKTELSSKKMKDYITKKFGIDCDDNFSFNDEPTYERYHGYYAQDEAGYSDDEIDIIFDGEPDAYWNID